MGGYEAAALVDDITYTPVSPTPVSVVGGTVPYVPPGPVSLSIMRGSCIPSFPSLSVPPTRAVS